MGDALTRWFEQAGVTNFLRETPQPKLFRPAVLPDPLPPGSSARVESVEELRPPVDPTGFSDSAATPLPGETARARAHACRSLAELEAAVRAADECALKSTSTNTVFADGDPEAALMIVGEAPGAEEDRLGRPFVGESGKLLDRMLAAIGIARAEAYITNILYWRPPQNRAPSAVEIAQCLPFVEKHIALIKPRLLVMAGGTAAKTLLARNEGITRLRGQIFSYTNPELSQPVSAMATFHPAYLLRTPLAKREAWRDWLRVKALLAPPG